MAYFVGKAGQDALVGEVRQRLLQLQFEAVTTAWSTLVLMDVAGIVAPVVRTGRYRANWVLGVGAPNRATPGPAGTPAAPSAAPSGPPGGYPGLQLGQVVFITNSVPYAGRLEAGHSAKAPAGVVGPVAQALLQSLDGVVRQIAGAP